MSLGNSPFGGSRFGGSTSRFGTSRFGGSRFTGSRFSSGFGRSGFGVGQPRFGRGFGFGDRGFGFRGRDFDFDDGFGRFGFGFGFDRFGFGFPFGFGFGFPFGFGFGFGGFGFGGFGPWWWDDPWLSPWYDPFWGPVGYSYPSYGYPPPDYNAPPPYDSGDNNGPNADLQAQPLPESGPIPEVQAEAPPDTNSYSNTANVAESAPSVLLYLKDGTTVVAWDYWVADGKLHYTLRYGGESTLEMDDLDLQRTVDENAKRGIPFRLKPQPVISTPPANTASATTSAAAA